MSQIIVPPIPADATDAGLYYYHLRQAELIAVKLFPEQSLTLSVLRHQNEPVRFYDGYAKAVAWGQHLSFPTPSQRVICELLWEPWQGNIEHVVKMPIKTVLGKAGLDTSRLLSRYFKDKARHNHAALGFLIHVRRELVFMGPKNEGTLDHPEVWTPDSEEEEP